MASSSKSFDRNASRFKPQPKVLVLCEDSKSGKRYLEEAAFHFRAKAQVEIVHCGVTHPSGIVERAVLRQKRFVAISGEPNPSTEIHLLIDEFETLSRPQLI